MRFPARDNAENPAFRKAYAEICDRFFSRRPEYWPLFGDPALQEILRERRRTGPPEQRLRAYPRGPEWRRALARQKSIPETWRRVPGADPFLKFAASLSKNWEDPASVENVVALPSDAAVFGSMMGILANANLVHVDAAGMAVELERAVVRQIAVLAGYRPERSAGIFTQGGTFANLYGYLLGIRKSLPEAKHYGMGHTHDYRMLHSWAGHYSNTVNLSLLGVNIREKTIRLRIGENNDVDTDDFERQLEACFRLKCVVPSILLTLGTTDTFGLDRIRPIVEIRDRLCARFGVRVKPHVHVDAAVGWTMLFFLDYDFARNPLRINARTLASLRFHRERARELRHADSFSVDFHKWGYVPYTSSLVMIRDKADLKALENDPENYIYFDRSQGQTHLQSTIECSRGAVGVFGAYASLRYLGMDGYRMLIANCLQNANYFRMRLQALPFVQLVAPENQGPSVAFRLYDPARVRDAGAEFRSECRFRDTREYRERLRRNNAFHRRVHERRKNSALHTSWVQAVAHSEYDAQGRCAVLPGEKAVFLNPATTRSQIDAFVEGILGA